jgi:hypothetical protein
VTLPTFKYHPDPIGTESIATSDAVCVCCESARGYIYVGPVWSEHELDQSLCPWCIADGSAHAKFAASFTDEGGIGGYADWEPVPKHTIEDVAYRTPGFTGWQQERWWTHCGDAAAFMGRAGKTELLAYGKDAILAIQISTGLKDGREWDSFFSALDKDGSPTAYVFRCIKCGALGGYQDCD